MGWGGWGHGWFGLLWMVLFWGAVVAAIVFATRWGIREPPERRRSPDAREILAERFARGEISAEEYRDREAVLAGEAERPRAT